MTYKEWAEEYKKSADMIKEKISSLKEQLAHAAVDDLREINYRISVLYRMYLDCMDTANILRSRKGDAFCKERSLFRLKYSNRCPVTYRMIKVRPIREYSV